jgi:hypothetical protein
MEGPSTEQGARGEHDDSSSEKTGDSQESKEDSSDLSDHRTKWQVKITDRAR